MPRRGVRHQAGERLSPLRFVPASTLDRAALVQAFNDGYSGYEVPTHLDEATFAFMAALSDFDLSRSVIGYEVDRVAAMAMLALRGERSWIGGMGVAPEFRGRGYGADAMRAVMANARAAGARVMHLEVLHRNAPAIRIYEALGFQRTRGLVVWLIEPEAPPPGALMEATIVPLDHGAALDVIDHWITDRAPWQRAAESIAHLPQTPAALGVMREGSLAGAVVYRAASGRVSFLALAAREPHREATLDALVAAVRMRHPVEPARFLNLPEGDPAEPVFVRLGAREEARQIEMRLAL